MKPDDAAITAGIIRKYGCTPIETASAATIGIIAVAVATFEATSESAVTATQRPMIISAAGHLPTNASRAPAHFENPLASSISARANPPPNRISTSHGIFLNSDQSSSRLSPPTGSRNAITAIATATVASLIIFAFGKRLDQPGMDTAPRAMSARNIQRNAVIAQSTSAVISGRDIAGGRSMPRRSSGTATPFGTRAVQTTISQHSG